MSEIVVKKITEFTSATLADDLLVPLSNTSGNGYKASLSDVRDYVSADTGYFVCSTAAATADKAVSASGFNLRTGGSMHIKFTYANTATEDVTLNVNSTGAIPLYLNGSEVSATNTWAAGDVMELFYDGTNWQATSAAAAVEARIQEALEDINEAEEEAMEAIEEAISGISISYENVSGNNVQLKGAHDTDINPITDASATSFDPTECGLDETNVKDVIDRLVDDNYVEGDFMSASELISADNWASRRLVIDTTAMTATSSTAKVNNSRYESNFLLPPGVISIKLTLDSQYTIPREISGVPKNQVKIGTNDVFGFIKSTTGSSGETITFTVTDVKNRIAIQLRSSSQQTAAGQLARLSSLEYTKMTPASQINLSPGDVVDNLGGTDHDKPLSADAGRLLAEKVVGNVSSTPTVIDDISDFNIYKTSTNSRYRPWVDVNGKCRIKIKCPASAQELGCRIVGYFATNYDIQNLTGSYKYLIFDEDNTEFYYDNYLGNVVMAHFNIQKNSGNLTADDITAINNCGLSIEYCDVESKRPLNVKDFGVVGDGTTDDAAALQSVLNMRGRIYIPSGTYKINTMLNLYSNTHIIMDPDTVILRGVTGPSDRFCIFDTWYLATTTGYNGEHDIVIEGGVLDLSTTYTSGGVGLGLQHAQRVTVKNVTFRHCSGHCIDMGGCKDVTIKGCVFTDLLTADNKYELIQLDGMGSYTAWPYRNYPDGSDCYDGTPDINVEISGCTFYLNNYSPAIGNHNAYRHHDINIHDNFFIGPGASNGTRGIISFKLNGSDHNETDLVYIHDNLMRDSAYGFQLQYGAMDGTTGTNYGRVIIKDNLMINITNTLTSDSTSPQKCTLSNNVTLTE